jgi:hypothetical protein
MEPNGYTTTFNRLIKEMLADQPQDFLEKTRFGKGLTEEDRLRREQREQERAEREAEKLAGSEGAGKTIKSRMMSVDPKNNINRWGTCRKEGATAKIEGTIYFYLDKGSALTLDSTDEHGKEIKGTFSRFIEAFKANVKSVWGATGFYDRREHSLDSLDKEHLNVIQVNVDGIQFLPLPSDDAALFSSLTTEAQKIDTATKIAKSHSNSEQKHNPVGILIVGKGTEGQLPTSYIAEGNLTGYINEKKFNSSAGEFDGFMPAHEFGHMLGLADRYFEGVAYKDIPSSPVIRRNYPVVIPELKPLGYNYLNNLYSSGNNALSQDQLEMVFCYPTMVERFVTKVAIADSKGIAVNTTDQVSNLPDDPDGLEVKGRTVIMYKNGNEYKNDVRLSSIRVYEESDTKKDSTGVLRLTIMLISTNSFNYDIFEEDKKRLPRLPFVFRFINTNRLYANKVRST